MLRRLLDKTKTDDGVALLLIGVSMTFIIGMAALAIDLGALRDDIRADRLAAIKGFSEVNSLDLGGKALWH